MSDLMVILKPCESCGLELGDSANFCGNCGVPVTIATLTGPQHGVIVAQPYTPRYGPQVVIVPQPQQSVVDQALNNRAVVIAIIVFAGPIGLPALWFSRRFSKRAKMMLTAAYFLVTAVLPLVAVWYFLEISLRPLLDIFGS